MHGKSPFDAALADKRWTAGYSLEPTTAVNNVRVSETVSTPQVALTAHQKYRQAMAIATDLAKLMSEVGMAQFCEQLDVLRAPPPAVSPPQAIVLPAAFDAVSPSPAVAPPPAVAMSLEQLMMPHVMRKRGRPKGAELTAMGLPKRRRHVGPQTFRTRLRERSIYVIRVIK